MNKIMDGNKFQGISIKHADHGAKKIKLVALNQVKGHPHHLNALLMFFLLFEQNYTCKPRVKRGDRVK